MLPSRSLPPLKCCLGTSPIQAEKLRPDQDPGVSNTRNHSGRQHGTDPGNVIKALARLVGPVPGHDHSIKLQNLPLETEQLTAKRSARHARPTAGTPFVARISHNTAVR